jgi:hypothetical protein
VESKTFGGDVLDDAAPILCGADVLLYRQVKRHGLLERRTATSRYTLSP